VYASEAKKLEFLVHLDGFSKYLNDSRNFENGLNGLKNQISLLSRHTQLSPIILSQVRLFSNKN
jgi:hypothetical protein